MKKMKARTLRTIVTFAVLVLVAIGYFTAWGIGNLSGFGWDAFSVLCPLGYLESLVAGKTFVPRAFISFVVILVLIVVFGRVFCAWICPMPTLQRLIPGVRRRKRKADAQVVQGVSAASCQKTRECVQTPAEEHEKVPGNVDCGVQSSETDDGRAADAATTASVTRTRAIFGTKSAEAEQNEGASAQTAAGEACDAVADAACDAVAVARAADRPAGKVRRVRFDSRFGVLLGALASAAIFGFPVFCLICPVGLTFATVLLVMRLFAFGDGTWAVVVVPLVLLIEVVFLRKWCGRFCPLGALISLVSGANRTLRPHVDDATCLFSSKGVRCFACSKACPERLDVRRPQLSEEALGNCTKCRECADACPAKAISFPVLPKADGSHDAPAPVGDCVEQSGEENE